MKTNIVASRVCKKKEKTSARPKMLANIQKAGWWADDVDDSCKYIGFVVTGNNRTWDDTAAKSDMNPNCFTQSLNSIFANYFSIC